MTIPTRCSISVTPYSTPISPPPGARRISATCYRVFKKEEDARGNPVWEQSHWMDEQDVLNSLRLHQMADDAIAEMKCKESFGAANEAA